VNGTSRPTIIVLLFLTMTEFFGTGTETLLFVLEPRIWEENEAQPFLLRFLKFSADVCLLYKSKALHAAV
jgi:hypothetical protein